MLARGGGSMFSSLVGETSVFLLLTFLVQPSPLLQNTEEAPLLLPPPPPPAPPPQVVGVGRREEEGPLPLSCVGRAAHVCTVYCVQKGRGGSGGGSALNVSDFGSKPCCRSLSRPGIPLLPTPPPGGFGFTRVSLPETPGPGGATGRLLFESELIFE